MDANWFNILFRVHVGMQHTHPHLDSVPYHRLDLAQRYLRFRAAGLIFS